MPHVLKTENIIRLTLPVIMLEPINFTLAKEFYYKRLVNMFTKFHRRYPGVNGVQTNSWALPSCSLRRVYQERFCELLRVLLEEVRRCRVGAGNLEVFHRLLELPNQVDILIQPQCRNLNIEINILKGC